MRLDVQRLARMMDLSAVRTDVTEKEIKEMVSAAREYNCVCVFPMPCYLPLCRELLAGAPEVGLGGAVGFPSGAQSTFLKVAETKQLLAEGVTELDMVMNVGWLLSGKADRVEEEIRAVVEAGEGVPVKVILEVHHLDDDGIRRGSERAVRAGAAFVKTGTGWAPTGATEKNITLIRETIGDSAAIKAAGGVRDLETLLSLYRCGATRFGVGHVTGVKILEECAALAGGAVEV